MIRTVTRNSSGPMLFHSAMFLRNGLATTLFDLTSDDDGALELHIVLCTSGLTLVRRLSV
jgi:hypothetical protein